MCGRYAFFMTPQKLKDMFGCENLPNFPPRYNAAPMQQMPIIIKNRAGLAEWGFMMKPPQGVSKPVINARCETVSQKPLFSESWGMARRCIIPMNGFYEWADLDGRGKAPYYIHDKNAACFAAAGLWQKQDGQVRYIILTKDANGAIKNLHSRMPILLRPDDHEGWFDGGEDRAFDIIARATGEGLSFHRVNDRVGSTSNDDDILIKEEI